MNKQTAALEREPASRGREHTAEHSHATTLMESTIRQQCYVRVLAYPILRQWPVFAPAVAVHLNMGTKQKTGIRVPVRMMRKCGMHPELGVNVALFKNRVVIWGDKRGGLYRQVEDSKQFMLPRSGISTKVSHANFAIVEGPDYLVLTTRADALKLAGGAPVIERPAYQKVDRGIASELNENLDAESVSVLGWKDVTVSHCHRMRTSRVANVSGHLWWLAGFNCGDALRFSRYRNATVVEKCEPGDKHSTLGQSGARKIPRHYFGTSLVDIHNADRVRVIATPGKLIVTQPGSNIGALCFEDRHLPRAVQAGQAVEPTREELPLEALVLERGAILRWRDYRVTDGRFTVSGSVWTRAGFAAREPAKLVRYDNAFAVEISDVENMDFRVGTRSQKGPYRNLGVVGTALEGESRVRVIVTQGRLVVVKVSSEIARLCELRLVREAPPSAPTKAKAAADQVERGRGRPTPWTAIARSFPQGVLNPKSLEVLAWKDIALYRQRVTISGHIWTVAGFSTYEPARGALYSNALVVEKCDESLMDFRIGSPSHDAPYRNIGLNAFGLGHLTSVRVIATKGRLIITPPNSDLGRQCKPNQAWPTTTGAITELLKTLTVPSEPPAKEVGSYVVPEGRRLQIQGRWLNQFGFKPGTKFAVTAVDGELRLELGAENGWSVTEHSPGSSKLYVPAQSLELLNADKVRVLGREGVLKLLPLAA
ncbi:hypothetical protein [Burkholderia ubonensis]|uniref:hypothetical protein n=1 Tax=Burkholderia ubonensis TaxID=101571 RepID=UPI000AEB552C|nr:hypothetical protein [Burkholderia ubonensis]